MNVLESFVEKSTPSPCHSIIITHVLPTAEKFINAVNKIFPISLVIAIPYSSDLLSIERLRKSGITIYLPSSTEDAFLKAGPLIEEVLQREKSPLLVQEVGGYLAGYTSILAQYENFLGIVEDTNNGHWRYVTAGSHNIPIVSMALSPIKDIEDTVIGDAVVYSLERVYREEFRSILQGTHSGIIGYGKIGNSAAIALKGRESTVSIYDIDPTKCIRAQFEGYHARPLHKLLEQSGLIVGCTGKTSIRKEDIHKIRHNSILVSASSKHEEFDIEAFNEECIFEDLSPVVRRYVQKNQKIFYLLNKGAPINFRDRSILGFILDMIYSELFLCMKLISQRSLPVGLQLSPSTIHAEVGKAWISAYAHEFADSSEDKIWGFPETAVRGLTSTFYLQMQHKGSRTHTLDDSAERDREILNHATYVCAIPESVLPCTVTD
jgi:adenosylhomocysteinase